MTDSEYIIVRRDLNLSPKRTGSQLTTDVLSKRVRNNNHNDNSGNNSSDSSVTEMMFQKFISELLSPPKYNKSKDNWFTLRMNQYLDAGILGLAILKQIEREEKEIDEEIERNALEIKHQEWKNKFLNIVQCNCASHLKTWHPLFIENIHNNEWLLDCKKLKIPNHLTILTDVRQHIKYIKVPTADSSPWKQKANQVMRYIDFECGFNENFCLPLGYCQPIQRQIYLAVFKFKVIGCIVAEPATAAYYLNKKINDVELVDIECSVKCGINRIWVNNGCRRNKVATALFKIVQYLFTKNEVLKEKDFAFSTVTNDGLYFAYTILKTRKIPIYVESPSWKFKSVLRHSSRNSDIGNSNADVSKC